MQTYKMKFNGRAFCKAEKKHKQFKRGEPIKGEFDGLLPDTYTILKSDTKATPKQKPATKKAKGER